MNIRLTYILLAIGFCASFASAQPVILAGQTTGANVQYTDLSPDSVETIYAHYSQGIPYYSYDTVRLDLDADGLDDIHFPLTEISEHMEMANLQALAVHGAAIAKSSPSANSPAQLALGDSIHSGLIWSASPWLGEMVMCLYSSYSGFWMAPTRAFIGVRTGSMRFGWVEVGVTYPQPRSITLWLYGYGVLTSPLEQEEEAGLSSGPMVWPNPTQGEVEIRWPAPAGVATIRVCDVQGRVLRMQEEKVQGNELKSRVYLGGLAAGNYVVEAVCGGKRGTTRLCVQ